MKNTISLCKKAKRFIVLLTYCSILFLPCAVSAQTGSTCATSTPLAINSCLDSFASADSIVWFSITPNDTVMGISLYNYYSTADSSYEDIELFSSCGSSTPIATASFSPPVLWVMIANGLISGNTYYLRLKKNSTNPARINICNAVSPLSTPCTCPPNGFNPNNPCDVICNGGFEFNSIAVDNWGQLNRACPWYDLTMPPAIPSTDLFNATNFNMFNVPGLLTTNLNYCGAQASYNGGNGYAGFIAYANDPSNVPVADYREYVVQQLSTPLAAGIQYEVTFYVSLADYCGLACRDIGASFYVNAPVQPMVATAAGTLGTFMAPAAAGSYVHTGTTSYINNDQLWTKIQGVVMGAGQDYIAIGQFTNDATNFPQIHVPVSVPAGNKMVHYSYYFVDSVSVHPIAPIVSAGNDTTICSGNSVLLNGQNTGAPATYTWTTLAGAVICNCQSITVTPTVTTTYIFYGTGVSGGCIDSDTMTVFVNPTPAPHIVVPAGAVTCDYTLTFTASNVPTGATVAWSSNAQVVLINNQTTYSADWTTDTVDGYVIIAVTLNNCTGYDTVIIPHCCCSHLLPNPIELLAINDNVDSLIAHYPLSVIVSGSNTIITSQNLCISGIFTVNRNLDLKNVSVSMGTNARINVLPGVTFTLEATGNTVPQQTFVHACDKMWDGIYVNSTAVLKVKDGTVIEDGKQAIVSVGGGVFQIQGGGGAGPVKLNKNLIAVWVKPFNGTHTGYIRNAIISCDAPGQSGSTTIIPVTSAGQNLIAPYNTTIGYIGVRIDSVTNITIGDSTQNNYRNVFERTRYGIYATKSNVNTWNNTFKFIQSTYIPTHSNPTPDGVAVYATNLIFGPAHLLTVGRLGTLKATNRFQECSYGVMAENQMNMNCEYNKFDSCFTISIFSQNNTLRTILINADTLHDCTGINIDCYKNNNSTVTITNNAMNQSATVIMSNFGQTGIYVANAMVATTHLLIQNNSIKKMRNGIWVSRVNNAKILDNGPITFIPGQLFTVANPATGIRIEQSVNVKVRNNLVKYTQNATFNQYNKMFGIYIVNCSNDTITKNTIKRMGSGIFLKGSDNPSLLACNKMDTCWYGINFGTIVGLSTVVTSDQIRFGASQTTTPTGNIWTQCNTDIVGRIFPTINWYRNNSYSPSLNMAGFSFVGNATTNLGSVAAHGDSCSNLLLPLAVPAVVLRSYLLEGICKTPRVYDTLSAEFTYNDQVFAYRTLRDNPSWLTLGTADDVYYQNFYSGYSSDPSFVNIVHLADAEDAIEAGDFSQAATDIASIRPKNVPEANRVAVIQVYLQSWALDTLVLTDEQVAILTPIANEGAISGGIATFDARNMLGIEVHDSSNLRLAQPQVIPNGISASHIYPNPTTGLVSIATDLPEGQSGTLDIYDLMGRRIASWQMIGGQSVYTFDASFLPTGTYIYQVSTVNKVITTDRLIMIKEE